MIRFTCADISRGTLTEDQAAYLFNLAMQSCSDHPGNKRAFEEQMQEPDGKRAVALALKELIKLRVRLEAIETVVNAEF